MDTSPTALCKVLSDPVRWRIVEALAAEELCVCHLVDDLDSPQPLISHHLKVLREAGLVESEKHSYWTYYRLDVGAFDALASRIAELVEPNGRSRARRACC